MMTDIRSKRFNTHHSKIKSFDQIYKKKGSSVKQAIDLREWDSVVEDQGQLNSCVSNAITNCYEIMLNKQFPNKFMQLSRLFVYYHTRLLEESLNIDDGVEFIRNSIIATKKYGICSEELWPYDAKKFKEMPTANCYFDAASRRIDEYQILFSFQDMFEVLNDNKPIVIGIKIYESFMNVNSKNPVIPYPDEHDTLVGGHSMVVLGYDLSKQQYLAKNSFGSEWGDSGYCYIPFSYAKANIFEQWCFDITNQNTILLS